MSERFYVQGTDASRESFNRPEQVQFEWNMLYACNFRCSYCFFSGKWEEYGQRNQFPGTGRWLTLWRRIFERYGRCSVLITGGEPFLYPDFIALIQGLSALHYPMNISTNGSGDLSAFVQAIDPQKVSLTISFHPEFNTLAEVLDKKKMLKAHGFDSEFINFVCYPPFLPSLDEWVEQAAAAGEKLKVIPISGRYQDRQYPDAYTPEEKARLGLGNAWETNVKRKGRQCKAGMRSALIFPDGKVARCGQVGERLLVGNILQDDFTLFGAPLPCDVDYCPCLESE
jgi:MoaA/NifB/PqqE/SkfB family radical SAM enzyme